MNYAADTSVSVGRSKGEIEDLIVRAGGTEFGTMNKTEAAVVFFEMGQRRIMFELPLPPLSQFAEREVRGRKKPNTPEAQQRAWEQACRSKWRALCLSIKAKLVSVASGVEVFEEAFLAQVVVPNGRNATRFGALAIKAIAQAYQGGDMPPLLGDGS